MIRILLTGLFAASFASLWACSCAPPGSLCAATGMSDAVFAGTVIEILDPTPLFPQRTAPAGRYPGNRLPARRIANDGEREPLPRPRRVIRMQVSEALTGAGAGQIIEIVTGLGGGDCGFPFEVGKQYFVYAGKDTEGRLATGICSRTRELEKAAEDLKYLRDNANSSDLAELQVRLGLPANPATAGERILIESDGVRRTAETDAGGMAVFRSVPPGEYVVRVESDEAFPDDPRVRVNARGCATVSLFRALRVYGRVTDKAGNPAPRVEVQARSTDGSSEWSGMTDKDGRYLLLLSRPGRYFTGINLNSPASRYSPYPRWFYPGTTDESLAATVEFSGRSGAQQRDFTLPDQQPVRVVSGSVSKPDGSTSDVIRVMATDGQGHVIADGTADTNGRFTLQLFADTEYRLHAVAPGNMPDAARSAVPARVEPGRTPVMARLILSEPGNSLLEEGKKQR